MSYRRWLLRRGPLLDHDTLFAVVYEKEHPLDVDAVRRAPHPVVATVANVDTGEAEYPDVRFGPTLAWLRASGRLPLGTGPVVEIDGKRYLDGGITDPVPVARAIEDGATEVVVVLNRPPGLRGPEPRAVTDLVARRFPALADAVRDHHGLHNRAVALAERPPAGVTVRIVRPATDTGVGRLTRDYRRVRLAIERGLADGAEFLRREAGVPDRWTLSVRVPRAPARDERAAPAGSVPHDE